MQLLPTTLYYYSSQLPSEANYHRLRTTDFTLPAPSYHLYFYYYLPTYYHFLLLSTYYYLPTTYYHLPIIYYLLPFLFLLSLSTAAKNLLHSSTIYPFYYLLFSLPITYLPSFLSLRSFTTCRLTYYL